MASLEQKEQMVGQYCNSHSAWVKDAQMHRQNYEAAISEYNDANRTAVYLQEDLDTLHEVISSCNSEIMDIQHQLYDGQEHSAYDLRALKTRLQTAINDRDDAERREGPLKEKIQQARDEAKRAYAVSQQEDKLYQNSQTNAEKFRQVLEQFHERLSQEANELEMKINPESSYASVLKSSAGNQFSRSALENSGALLASSDAKKAVLTRTQVMLERIYRELNGGDPVPSTGTKVLRRR